MAEQEIYGSHIGLEPGRASAAFKSLDFSHSPGAEQERYASHFGLRRGADLDKPVEPTPSSVPPPVVAPPPPIASPSFTLPGPEVNTTAVGILKSTLLPSLGLHSGLSLVAYTGARVADRVEAKDWLWPSGQVINAWWSAIGTRIVNENITLSDAFSTLSYSEKLLLGAVTAWGGRLFYRIASRGIERGRDDPRYEVVKDEHGFWNKAFFTTFLPEAFFQTLITLPFTLPFREPQASTNTTLDLPAYAGLAHGLAVFLFSSGFGLEVLADVQLGRHKDSNSLNTDGVWSVVRHPNYLGDALVHASFPLLVYSSGFVHPLVLLGPIANYVFLRYVGGDRENEAHQEQRYFKEKLPKYQQLQEYKSQKNSFWPKLSEVQNPWYWTIVALGVGGVVLERGLRDFLRG